MWAAAFVYLATVLLQSFSFVLAKKNYPSFFSLKVLCNGLLDDAGGHRTEFWWAIPHHLNLIWEGTWEKRTPFLQPWLLITVPIVFAVASKGILTNEQMQDEGYSEYTDICSGKSRATSLLCHLVCWSVDSTASACHIVLTVLLWFHNIGQMS